MLQDNIRKYRKEKGFSQEELAVRLHVVRQTISKWEKGQSVPDAAVLIDLARVLELPVSKLLGIETADRQTEPDIHMLTEELARLNEQLAEKSRQVRIGKQVDEKRGFLLFCSFLSMLATLVIKNTVVSIVLSGICLLVAILILYRNLALFTSVTTDDLRMRSLRAITMFNIFTIAAAIAIAALTAAGIVSFSEQEEKLYGMLVLCCIMIVTGMIAPGLPFTRYTGLRLPWTIRDPETFHLAHRILGCLSLPLVFLYVACALTIPYFEKVTLTVILLWIGIPGALSYLFFWKKMHGRHF